jgi:hypothetical protein
MSAVASTANVVAEDVYVVESEAAEVLNAYPP